MGYPEEGTGLFQYLKDLFSGDKYKDETYDPWQEQSKRRREESKKKKGKD